MPLSTKPFSPLRLLLAWCCFIVGSAYGEVTSPQLKAALTYQLLNHVTWVNDASIKQLDIAYWGTEDAYYTELKKGLSESRIRDKSLRIIRVDQSSFNAEIFEVLIVGAKFATEVSPLLNKIRRSNTLVITDSSPLKKDFMINIFVTGENKIRFEINKTNIIFEGLTLDKNVYLLGGTELDVAELFRDSEYELQKIKENLVKTTNDLLSMEEKLKEQNDVLSHHAEEIANQQKAIALQDEEFMKKMEENIQLSDKIDENNQILETQKLELQNKNLLINKQNIILLAGGIVLAIFYVLLIVISRISKQRNRIIAELKQVKNELEISREEEKKANEQKSIFLAKMSHEIRTPMSGVLGMSELLDYTPLSNEQKSLNRSIREAGKVLLSVINDILDFSKLEAGRVILESVPFSLETLLADVSNIFSTLKKKDVAFIIDLKADLPRMVVGDPLRLQQILVNLIGNAFKFTEKGRVSVIVTRHPVEPAHIRFAVVDTGIGISDLNQKRLFSAFVQADDTITRSYGGTGLGLVICKQLVEQMGGQITCESQAGKGSTFWFDIPLPEESRENILAGRLPGRNNADELKEIQLFFAYPLRTLVAEDNELLQSVMKGIFKQWDLEADFVNDGAKVLQTLSDHPGSYDLILMDCEMPMMDGVETTRKIRALELQKNIPAEKAIKIIALTAHVQAEYTERCKNAGMDDILIKPVDTLVLKKMLAHVIKGCLSKRDPLNGDVLCHYYENNRVRFKQALTIFQSSAIPELQELVSKTENPTANDLQHIAHLTHKHQTSAYMMGANQLGHILRTMNKLAKTGSSDGIKLFNPYLRQSMEETSRQIQAALTV